MSTNVSYRQIARDGLWVNNVGLVQLLGLCPLLAVSNTLVNGVGLGLATTLVLLASNVTVSLIRGVLRREVRIPVFVVIIASFVTAVDLVLQAWFYDLHRVLGLFVPLIVTNCAIIGRAEAFASRHSVGRSAVDGLTMGAGFTLLLAVLGALREIVGRGTLFDGAEMLLGAAGASLRMTFFGDYGGFLLAALPPGAFLGLGGLVALKNALDARRDRLPRPAPAGTVAVS